MRHDAHFGSDAIFLTSMHGTKWDRDCSDLCNPCPHPSAEFEASTDLTIDSLVLTLLPCLPWTRLESFMRAREFCLGVAACVPAARVTVCGNVLLGPPRPSLTMSKLQRISNDQSASHSMLHSLMKGWLNPTLLSPPQSILVPKGSHTSIHVTSSDVVQRHASRRSFIYARGTTVAA